MDNYCLNTEIDATMDGLDENVNDYTGSYYGTVNRYRDTGYQYKKLTQINGEDLAIAEFIDADECEQHTRMCSNLTNSLRDMKHRHKTWELSVRDYKIELNTKWMPLAEELIEHWGEEMVPHDVRVCIHEVMMKLHHRAGRWPPILMLGMNDTITTPNVVDHVGRMVGGN